MSKIKRAAALAALMLATAASACSGKQQTEAQSSPPPLAQPTATPAAVMPAAVPGTASAVATTAAVAAGPATSDPAAGLTSSDGEQTGTRVIVNSLKRGPNMLTLRFTLRNDSSAPLETSGNHFGGGGDYIDTRNVSGIFLTDAAAKKKYFVVADTDKHCLCSEHVDDVPAKAAVTLWAQFPAPPPNVQKITVTVPHFQPLDDVAISS